MPGRPGPFVCGQIALALARQPGRLEIDEDEAYRILNQIIACWEHREFAQDEVVVLFGEPPQLQPLDLVLEHAKQRGEPLDLWPRREWRDGIMLTATAARRYLEGCGLAGAPRILREWFSGVLASEPASVRGAAHAPENRWAGAGKQPQPAKGGRKLGSGSVDDETALQRMLKLLAAGKRPSVLAAARKVAAEGKPHQSVDADVSRLRRKFRQRWGTNPPEGKTWADVDVNWTRIGS